MAIAVTTCCGSMLGLLALAAILVAYMGALAPAIEPPTCKFPIVALKYKAIRLHETKSLIYSLYMFLDEKQTCVLCQEHSELQKTPAENLDDNAPLQLKHAVTQLKGRRPIIFVHGSAGHFTQARFFAQAFFERKVDKFDAALVDVYSIDFREEFSAFSAAVLRRQAEYLNRILTLLSIAYDVPSIDILAHSMGGVVTRIAATLPSHKQPSPLRLIFTLATPHAGSPLPISKSMQDLYLDFTNNWQQEHRNSSAVFISLYGGTMDNQVSPALTQVSNKFAIAAPTAAIVGFDKACCHQSISYCPTLMEKLVDAFMFEHHPKFASLNPSSGAKERAAILEIINDALFNRKKNLSGLKDTKLKVIDKVSNGIVEWTLDPQSANHISWKPRVWWASYYLDLKGSYGDASANCALKVFIQPEHSNFSRVAQVDVLSSTHWRVFLHAMAPQDKTHDVTLAWDCGVPLLLQSSEPTVDFAASMMRFSREYALVSAVSQPFGLFYFFLGSSIFFGVFKKCLSFPKFKPAGMTLFYGGIGFMTAVAFVLSSELTAEPLFKLLKLAACLPRPSMIQSTLALFSLAEKAAAIIVNSFVSVFILGAIMQGAYILSRVYKSIRSRLQKQSEGYTALHR